MGLFVIGLNRDGAEVLVQEKGFEEGKPERRHGLVQLALETLAMHTRSFSMAPAVPCHCSTSPFRKPGGFGLHTSLYEG